MLTNLIYVGKIFDQFGTEDQKNVAFLSNLFEIFLLNAVCLLYSVRVSIEPNHSQIHLPLFQSYSKAIKTEKLRFNNIFLNKLSQLFFWYINTILITILTFLSQKKFKKKANGLKATLFFSHIIQFLVIKHPTNNRISSFVTATFSKIESIGNNFCSSQRLNKGKSMKKIHQLKLRKEESAFLKKFFKFSQQEPQFIIQSSLRKKGSLQMKTRSKKEQTQSKSEKKQQAPMQARDSTNKKIHTEQIRSETKIRKAHISKTKAIQSRKCKNIAHSKKQRMNQKKEDKKNMKDENIDKNQDDQSIRKQEEQLQNEAAFSNSKIAKEPKAQKLQIVSNYLSDVLLCQICQQFIVIATETQCGHCFCEQCLDNYFLAFKECPICEKTIRGKKILKSKKIDEIIEDFVKTLDEEDLRDYRERCNAAKQIKKKSRPDSFEVGTKIDIRDQHYFWHEGVIVRKHTRKENETRVTRAVTVQFLDSSERAQEIQPTSERLGRAGHYTNHHLNPKFMRNILHVEGIDDASEVESQEEMEQQVKSD